ncbi:hypothetical protein V7426_22355 [Bacillus thuringiensis]|uniref:hypothetical protein n=1 Tax=Bacillus thuringiensis TaxID=1428 RepID=UPI0014827513|nr:hypothetical protein [Bacillus thuringiensis]MEC0038481.1 hypothetical protein [Bacillus cereus]
MKNHKKAIKSPGSVMKPDFAETDAQKVQQEIQNDVRAGQGAMTSREAGAMRD